jgi:hypothetical protein
MSMLDILNEATISLAEACQLLPRGRNGAKPHLSTLIRWISKGAPRPDGTRIRLSAVRVGAKWVTSRQALQRFAVALTPLAEDSQRTTHRTPRQRQRASECAAKQLDRIGI